jgi:hypothetical protein
MRAQTGVATKRESRLNRLECGELSVDSSSFDMVVIFESALLDLYFILSEHMFCSLRVFILVWQAIVIC